MNKTIIFRKIGGIISEITEQYQYLADHPENINPLELELFIANSHFLSEHLAILKKIDEGPVLLNEKNTPNQVQEKEDPDLTAITPENVPVEKAAADSDLLNQANETGSIKEVENEPGSWFKPVESEADVPYNRTEVVEFIPLNGDVKAHADVVEDAENPASSISEASGPSINTEITEKGVPAIEDVKIEVKNTTIPEVDEKVPTLNEVLSAGRTGENVAFKMNQHESRDLKSMIKLNDKLMFVRDLFNGYSLAYSEAIELVNRFDNFEAAENFLKQNYADKNKWSEKQSTVDQFYEILNRRFS